MDVYTTEGAYSVTTKASSTDPYTALINYNETHPENLERDRLQMQFFAGPGCRGSAVKAIDLAEESGSVTFTGEATGTYSFLIWQERYGEQTQSACLGSVSVGRPEFAITSSAPPFTITEDVNYILEVSGTCKIDGALVASDLGTVIGDPAVCANGTWQLRLDVDALPDGANQLVFSSTYSNWTYAFEVGLVKILRTVSPGQTTLVASPSTLAYGNTSLLTITLKNSLGIAKEGIAVTLSVTGTGAVLTQPVALTDAAGVVTASVTSAVPVSAVVRIASPASLSSLSATVVFTDTIPPHLSGAVNDGTYGNQAMVIPNLSWTAATDAIGVDHYELAIGTSSGGSEILAWTNVGTSTSLNYTNPSLVLTNGTTYYPKVRAVDTSGNASSAIFGDGWIVDTVAPSVSGVTFTVPDDSWTTTSSPTLSWSAANDGPGSGIANYQIRLGTSSGAGDVGSWTDIGNTLTTTLSGLNLSRGSTYYPSLRAIDAAGNFSAPIAGTGWLVNSELWTANGSVHAVVKSGSRVYIGGEFTRVGPWIGGGLPLSSTTGAPTWSPSNPIRPRVAGTVNTVVSDGAGGWFIGGNFTSVGGVSRNNLAHINPDGSVNSSFNPNPNGRVLSMALSGSTILVGGEFTNIASLARTGIAALSAVTGDAIVGFNALADSHVRTIIVSGSIVYVGGNFSAIGGQPRLHIASISVNTGLATAPLNDLNASLICYDETVPIGECGFVSALSLSGTTLYVGGDFDEIGGQSRTALAAISTIDGSLSSSFIPPSGLSKHSLTAIVATPSVIYVGGDLTVGAQTKYLFALSAADGSRIATFDPDADRTVTALALSGSTLFASGHFTNIGGASRVGIAALSVGDGSTISSFDAHIDEATFYAVAVSGPDLYVGGSYCMSGSQVRNNIAALSMTDGQPISSFNPNSNQLVNTLALSGTSLYVGGNFRSIGGQSRNYIAAISTSDGAAVSGFNPSANGTIQSLTLSGTTLYVGGSFNMIGGLTRNHIAAVSTLDGSVFPGFDPNSNGTINTIAVSGTTLYVGGSFSSIGGLMRNNLAAVSTTDGSALPGFSSNPSSYVSTILTYGSTLYVGGTFSSIGGLMRNNLAAVSTTDGSVLPGFNPNVNGQVSALALIGNTLYLGGLFSTVSGQSKINLAAVSTTDGAVLPLFSAPSLSVINLTVSNNTLYIGGFGPTTSTAIAPSLSPVSGTTGSWLPGF